MTNPTANRPQAEFLALPHKYRGFVAGYGTGKTWVGGMANNMHFMAYPKVNAGYFAPTYAQIRDIFYPTIDEVACSFGNRVEIRQGNKEVHFYRGPWYIGTTICRSMDDPSKIIGFKIGHAICDEMDTLNVLKAKKAFEKIQARMRYKIAGLKNGIDIITTPEGFKWTYQQFEKLLIEKPERRKNYAMVQASTYENEANLPDDYINSLIENYPEELIAAYLRGEFTNLTSGTVYYGYNRKANRSKETIQPNDDLRIGMDFNVGKMAAVVYVIRSGVWHAVDELKDIRDTPAMINTINERFKDHLIYVYPDSSGKSKKSVDASKSDISLLEDAKYAVLYNSRNPFVKDRILSANAAFQKLRVMVNDTICPTYSACLEQQAYDDNGEPDKKSGHDHQNDAGTYPIVYEMPIVKPIPNINLSMSF